MSEIMNQTIYDLGEILLDALAQPSSIQDAIKRILSIKTLAVVDREAKVPQRQRLADGNLLLKAQDKNDIYLNGQIIAQEKMLNAGWVKEDE